MLLPSQNKTSQSHSEQVNHEPDMKNQPFRAGSWAFFDFTELAEVLKPSPDATDDHAGLLLDHKAQQPGGGSSNSLPDCTAIVCAYNEEANLARVIDSLLASSFIQEIIVVDDGSRDGTAAIIAGYSQNNQVKPIFLTVNRGKGYAMAEAATHASKAALLFVDADLPNWNPAYGFQVLQPLFNGQARMVIGYPFRKHDAWDAIDPLRIQHWLSGERAVWRKDLLPVLGKLRHSRFGVETIINMYYRVQHLPIRHICLDGLVHPVKFQKECRRAALRSYVSEISEICLALVRHPKLAMMTFIPDLIEMRQAYVAVTRRSSQAWLYWKSKALRGRTI